MSEANTALVNFEAHVAHLLGWKRIDADQPFAWSKYQGEENRTFFVGVSNTHYEVSGMVFADFQKSCSLGTSERAGLNPILITFKKTPQQIAKDIERRLLPGYEKSYQIMVERLAETMKDYTRASSAAYRAKIILWAINPRLDGKDDPKATPTLTGGNGSVSLHSIRFYQNSTCWDRISFNMELSMRLFQTIAEYVAEQSIVPPPSPEADDVMGAGQVERFRKEFIKKEE